MNQSINTQTQYTIQIDVQHSGMKQKGMFIHTHTDLLGTVFLVKFLKMENDFGYQDYHCHIKYGNI